MAQAVRRRDPGWMRPTTIAAAGLLALLLVVYVLANRHTTTPQTSAPASSGFPPPQTVPTQTFTLKQVADGRVSAWAMWQALVGPNDVLVGSNGLIWVAEQNRATVDSFDPASGTLTRYEAPKAWQDLGAFELTKGADGSVWFSGYPGGAVGRVLPNGTVNAFPGLLNIAGGISTASDGSIWVGGGQDGRLVRVSPDGGLSSVQAPATNGQPAFVRDLGATPQAVWFTMPTNDAVGEITSNHEVHTFALPKGSDPYSLAGSSDGSVWVTLQATQQLAHVQPDGSIDLIDVPAAGHTGHLASIGIAPDGTLWVTQFARTVLHLRQDGTTIEEVELPAPTPTASGLSIAPDGTVWVAASDGNMIVRIAPRAS